AEVERLELEFPIMLKPVKGEGGFGVRRVDTRAELSAVLDGHMAEFGRSLIAQEVVRGEGIDLSVLADHGQGVAWTIQQRLPFGSQALEFLLHPRVLEMGSAVLRSTGYHGVVHFDMRIDERTKEPVFLEANPRFWGSLRHSVWMGVNFPALGIAMARGENVG